MSALARFVRPLARRPAWSAALVVAVIAGAPIAAGERYSGLDHTRNLVATLCAYSDATRDRSVLDELRGDGPLLEDPQGLYFAPDVRALAAIARLARGDASGCGSAENIATAFSWIWLVVTAPCAAFLAASFGGRRRARFIAGVAQPLLGTTIDLVLHGSFLVEAALVPLIWAGARNLRRRKLRAGDACAVALGFALLTVHGDLFMDLVAGVVVVAEALTAAMTAIVSHRDRRDAGPTAKLGAPLAVTPSTVERHRSNPKLRVLAIAASAFAGLLLSCIQLAPSVGLGSAVQRAHGVESTTVWPLEMPEAIGVLLPVRAYERVDVGATLATAWHGDAGARVEWNSTPFLGAFALAALLASFFVRRTRPLAIAALIGAVFAAGAHTPLFPIATKLVPPLALFRYPAKYFELTSLCAAVALAILVEGASRSAASLLRRRLRNALAAVAALLAAVVVALAGLRTNIDAAAAHVATHAPFAGMSTLSSTLLVAAVQSTLFAIAGALLASRARTARWLALVAPAEIVLAAIAALPASTPIFSGPTQAPRPLQSLPPGSEVCVGREIRARHLDATAPDGSRVDLQLFGDTLADVIDNKPNVGACGGPSFPDDYMPSSQHTVVQLSRYLLDEERGVIGPAIALGCTHLATRAPFADPEHDAAHLGLVPIALAEAAGAPRVYSISDAVPDVAIARNARVVDDEPALFAKIVAAHGAADVLAVVDDPELALTHGEPRSRDIAFPGGAGVTRVDATFASALDGTITLAGAGGALVVLRRQWWPGWSATQNGIELPVVRVGGRELGVVVDDVARGNVELHYRVRGLRLGVVSCAIGAALLGAIVAFIRSRARRS